MIKIKDIKKYSNEMLNLLKREDIKDIDGLQKKMGESFAVSEGIIQLEERPGGPTSIPDSTSFVLSYIIQGKGIPLEVRLNPQHGYSIMIIKSEDEIAGYHPEFYDPLGNIIQDKRFELSFDRMIEQLQKISKLK